MYTAIVLNREDCRERDQRIFLYTKEHGLLSVIARGVKDVKSKQSMRLEPGVVAGIALAPSELTLRFSEPEWYGAGIRRSWHKSCMIRYMLGITAQLLKPGQPDDAMYAFLRRLLSVYNEASVAQCLRWYPAALWRFLGLLGFSGSGAPAEWHTAAQHYLECPLPKPPFVR